MFFLNKKIKVAVHDRSFHSDDVFAVAILSLYLDKPLKIFRTRDLNILTKMDYLLDVGREYKPNENKFDHHQEGWNEKRKNGIPYATSGLVWKEYGEKICGTLEVANEIDNKIIQTIDAEDNGIEIYKSIFSDIRPYCIFDYVSAFNPTWNENINDNESFDKAVILATNILKREIVIAKDYVLSKNKIDEIYNKTEDKRILFLDSDYDWKEIIKKYPEPLFVIKNDNNWSVKAVSVEGYKYKNRLDFPESWAGKEGEELVKVTGISDAVFCHNNRFLCIAKSKEGAIELAKKALANSKL